MRRSARWSLRIAGFLLLVVGLVLIRLGALVGGLVLGLAGLAGVLAAARAGETTAPARAANVPPPAGPLPALEDLDGLPFPLTACARCGYPAVRFPGIRDGVWPGGGETGARFVCPRCGFQGIPVEFEAREDYRDFLAQLADGGASPA